MNDRDQPTERLGHGSGSLKDIRRHKWMISFNWEALKNRTLKAPYLLAVSPLVIYVTNICLIMQEM